VSAPPPIPGHRRRPAIPPPPRPGHSGTLPRQDLPRVPVLDDPTPKNTNPTLVVYQALLAVFDDATPAERLEMVELLRLYGALDAADKRRVLELAVRLGE
jgi:hypothetical protein